MIRTIRLGIVDSQGIFRTVVRPPTISIIASARESGSLPDS